MKHFTIVLATLVAVATTSIAQTRYAATSQFLLPTKASVPGLASNASSAKAFDFSAAEAKSLFFCPENSITLSNFPVSMSEQKTVRLHEARSPFGPQTYIWKLGKGGSRTELALPQSRCFSGSIDGEDASKVFVVMSGNALYGSIERASGLMIQLAPATTKEQTEILSDNTHGPSPTFYCGNEDMQEDYSSLNFGSAALQSKKSAYNVQTDYSQLPMLMATVAIETDRFLWAKMGKDEAKITSYLYTIWATVSYVYEREVSVGFRMGDILIHTDDDPDPYTQNANGDIRALLQEFTSYWNQNYGSVSRSVAVLYTVPGKTDVGGIAWLRGLCTSDQGYATCGIRTNSIMPTQGYQWDCFVTAHEVGHTFWAPHTHACVWDPPLDSCVSTTGSIPIADACWNGTPIPNKGSIMSYCHLISENPGPRYTFLHRVDSVVRFGAEHSPCLVSPTGKTLFLAEPIGGPDQIVRIDTGINVQWLSANIDRVTIEYSLNGGSTFLPISNAIALPATDRNFRWIPPGGTNSTQAMIRIFDSSDPTIADSSYAVFTLGAPDLKLQGWTGGRRIGRKTREQIAWTRTFLSSNSVQFSATGSDPWTDLATDTTATVMLWTVPDVDAATARLRLVGAGGAVIDLSEPFAIGTPTLTILSPKTGDTACSGYKEFISWVSDFIPSIDIKYSRNNGGSFPLTQVVSGNADATVQSFIWTVPTNKQSDSAMIRITNLADVNQQAFSERFVIGSCTFDDPRDVRESPEQNGLRITRIYPTPATDALQLSISNARALSAFAQIDIIAGNGTVALSVPTVVQLGEQVISIPLANLASGPYVVALHSDGVELSLPFVIVR